MVYERWLPIPGFVGYEASSLGRIKIPAHTYTCGRGRVVSLPATIRTGSLSSGYRQIRIGGQNGKVYKVHRLVAMAFYHEPPFGAEVVRHLDGDSLNNQATNLAWGSHSENALDTVRHGTHKNASKDHCQRGHRLSGDNLYVYIGSNGQSWRVCRECRRNRDRIRRSKISAKRLMDLDK